MDTSLEIVTVKLLPIFTDVALKVKVLCPFPDGIVIFEQLVSSNLLSPATLNVIPVKDVAPESISFTVMVLVAVYTVVPDHTSELVFKVI